MQHGYSHGYPSYDVTPRPPQVVPTEDASRWAETGRRRRLLGGMWRGDLDERVLKLVGTERRDAWGETSLAINPFANICRELSVLYDSEPDIRHDSVPTDGITGAVHTAGLWPMMQMVQYYTLGLGNMLVRVNATATGSLQFRPVFPDMVVCESSPDRPDMPTSVHEYRLREIDGEMAWTCDVLDISNPEHPVYAVVRVKPDGKGGHDYDDITARVLSSDMPEDEAAPQSMSGDAYPYRRRDGRPVLPYVMYYARRDGFALWQPYRKMELVEGTLDAAVLHQMLMHTWRDASWPQRYVVNLQVAGAQAIRNTDGTAHRGIVTDPASLLELESPPERDDNTQPMVGQFKPGGDIAVMEKGIADFVARLAQSADVPPSDIQRMTGQAQSGAAISLNNQGKRAAQKRYAASFRDSDERLIMTAAILANRATESTDNPTRYVEGGYRVVYREIPVSPEERKARREEALAMLGAGLIDKPSAYRVVYPEATEEDAREAVFRASMPVAEAGEMHDRAAVQDITEEAARLRRLARSGAVPADEAEEVAETILDVLGRLGEE